MPELTALEGGMEWLGQGGRGMAREGDYDGRGWMVGKRLWVSGWGWGRKFVLPASGQYCPSIAHFINDIALE